MSKIKYDANLLKSMSFFEKVTRTKLKDCIINDDEYIFIVPRGFIGKAVGKSGKNVGALNRALNRKIKIVEFNPNILQFIKNCVYPLKVEDISEENKIVTITGTDTKTKGLLIGRNASNLRQLESIVRRFFEVSEIKVK